MLSPLLLLPVLLAEPPFRCPLCRSPFDAPKFGGKDHDADDVESDDDNDDGDDDDSDDSDYRDNEEIHSDESEEDGSEDEGARPSSSSSSRKNLEANSFTLRLLAPSPRADFDPNNVTCEICEEAEAEGFCGDRVCLQFHCNRCKKRHLKTRATSHHQFLSLEEGLEGYWKDGQLDLRIVRCDEHLPLEVNTYCPRCEEACCSECAVDRHINHGVVRVEELAPRRKEGILNGLSQVLHLHFFFPLLLSFSSSFRSNILRTTIDWGECLRDLSGPQRSSRNPRISWPTSHDRRKSNPGGIRDLGCSRCPASRTPRRDRVR